MAQGRRPRTRRAWDEMDHDHELLREELVFANRTDERGPIPEFLAKKRAEQQPRCEYAGQRHRPLAIPHLRPGTHVPHLSVCLRASVLDVHPSIGRHAREPDEHGVLRRSPRPLRSGNPEPLGRLFVAAR